MTECKLCGENRTIKERGLCAECSIYSDEQLQKFKFSEEIQQIIEDVVFRKKAYLRLYGWESSCSFPDACWRWVKSIKGVTLALSLDGAYHIEQTIFHYQN